MTLDEVKRRVDDVAKVSDDSEVAHIYEDKLRQDFIEYVASYPGDIGKMAELVLTTNDMEFQRWCA